MKHVTLKKGWPWLLYIYVVLPLVLFLAALLFKNASIGVSLARLFHSYNLYVINPIPDLPSLTGLVGLVFPLYFFYKSLRARDYLDFGLCVLIVAVVVLYFFKEWNYLPLRFLSF